MREPASESPPPNEDLQDTERRNPATHRLDELPVAAVLRLINEEDRRVPEAVSEALPRIAVAVEVLVSTWRGGGRWIYVGAGTSGRIAAMDAIECPPTFGVYSGRVRAIVAGGAEAALREVGEAEDDDRAAVRELEALDLRPEDTVIGLSASGRTPYVLAAIRYAAGLGCETIGIANNDDTELSKMADVVIEVLTGPEVLTGSTRLKAGTAQKLVLNMLSTAAFTRLDKVYENFMVDVQATNAKLRNRARRIVRESGSVTDAEAAELLHAAGGSVKMALVMAAGVTADEARRLLDAAQGSVRRALDAAET